MNPLLETVIAGVVASFACGLGALPLAFKRLDVKQHVGLGYAFAGGLMVAASVYNLLMPALNLGQQGTEFGVILPIVLGILGGAAFIWFSDTQLTPERVERLSFFGGRSGVLIVIAMAIHSIPEGVAVGVGYASASLFEGFANFGHYIAIAIAIHNIPEGLAVAIPLRSKGASILKAAFVAFLTSLPQPIAAIPAFALAWFFTPLIVPLLGFAAGAMIYLVIFELIPEALETHQKGEIAWWFIFGFCTMILVQILL